jgi:hypothetical protein
MSKANDQCHWKFTGVTPVLRREEAAMRGSTRFTKAFAGLLLVFAGLALGTGIVNAATSASTTPSCSAKSLTETVG